MKTDKCDQLLRTVFVKYRWTCFSVLIVSMTVLYAGCCNECRLFRTNPVATETRAGGDYLVALHKENRLVGDSKDNHGELTSDPIPTDLKEVKYPFSETFHVVMKGASYTNNYTVGRQSQNSEWQLQRAWRTDPQGRTMEEWPVHNN
jgi:hypothetical protein